MTETSLEWSGIIDPDAGPYTDDQWSDWKRKLFTGARSFQGVVPGYLNALSASGAASPITINSGAAIVDGKYYESDAAENIVIPTPAGATRIDVIVARKTWASQQVRLTRIVGVEGNPAPAISQLDGVTWDVPLWQASITVGGVITLTDRRRLAVASLAQRPICQGRLTLTTGVPVTNSDVTAATTIYFAPYKGNHVSLFNGSFGGWVDYSFSELSLTVPNVATQMYDVFIYDAGEGVLTLEAVAWTNDTTRNIALTAQDGEWLKSTDNRLWLGSFRTTGVAGQTEDSKLNRLLYNYFNRMPRTLVVHDNTNSWTYQNANTYRQANANAANQVTVVQGISEDMVDIKAVGNSRPAFNSADNDTVGVALDATNTNDAAIISGGGYTNTQDTPMFAHYMEYVGIGYHYLAWTEKSANNGAPSTFYGDKGLSSIKTGLVGHMRG